MDHNITLNTTCEFDGYLIYKMPADMVEMELKIKTRRGSILSTRIPTLEQRGIIHGEEQTRGQRFTPGEVKER